MVKILDCTTRDGGYTTNWEFDNSFVLELIQELNNSNIEYYEIGYRNHFDNANKGAFYNCTPEKLKEYYYIKKNLKIGVMVDFKRIDPEDFSNAEQDYVDFVRIACYPDKIDETLKMAELLHSRGYKVFVQLMDISNVTTEGYINLSLWQNKDILECIYFADTYGQLYPTDIKVYFNKLKTLGFKNIGFHAHNKVNTALQNSLEAIKLGAYSVDVTSNGIGRNGGNLNRAELLSRLQ